MKNVAIKDHHLYLKAYSKGEKCFGTCTAVYILRDYAAKHLMNAHPEKVYVNRLGISVSKKYGGATLRNRAKRIIREAFRAVEKDPLIEMKKGYLIVIAVREGCLNAKAQDIESELRRAFGKLGFIKKKSDDAE